MITGLLIVNIILTLIGVCGALTLVWLEFHKAWTRENDGCPPWGRDGDDVVEDYVPRERPSARPDPSRR